MLTGNNYGGPGCSSETLAINAFHVGARGIIIAPTPNKYQTMEAGYMTNIFESGFDANTASIEVYTTSSTVSINFDLYKTRGAILGLDMNPW